MQPPTHGYQTVISTAVGFVSHSAFVGSPGELGRVSRLVNPSLWYHRDVHYLSLMLSEWKGPKVRGKWRGQRAQVHWFQAELKPLSPRAGCVLLE